MNEKISIVIPCYQAEQYIDQCLKCIKNQTYPNLEVIFVDDGSTDHTLEKLKQLQQENEIIVLHEKNAGVSSARNLGIEAASGEYLTFLDVDDTLDKHFCEYMIINMLKHNVGLVSSKMKALKYQEKYVKDTNHHTFTKSQLKNQFDFLYGNWFFHNVCGKLYRTDIAKKCLFPKGIRVGEDLLYNLQYFRKIDTYALLNYYGYVYEINLNSAVHKYQKEDFIIQMELRQNSQTFYEDYFGEVYHGVAINTVYINNVIDIINVCMTWAAKKDLIDAISFVREDPSLFELFSKTIVTGNVRKFIQFNVKHNHIMLLYMAGQMNARRHR